MTSSNAARQHLEWVVHLVDLAINGLKLRDRREPKRTEKELAEEKLALIIRQIWRGQRERIRRKLETVQYLQTKQWDFPDDWDEIWDDPDLAYELIKAIQAAARGGVELFGDSSRIDFDYTMTNAEAAEWASKYAFDLIKDINDVSMESLRSAIEQFIDTPGMTLGDVMDLLPYDEDRAARIAGTEITRAYAQGQIMAGDALREEFPDMRIIKTWFTNEDELVCELCQPLAGSEIELNEDFYDPEPPYQDGNPPRHVNCRCWIETVAELPD